MELRAVLVLLSTVLTVVSGQRQCAEPRKCVPFSDCVQYRPYAGIPARTWPKHVQNQVRHSRCGVEQGKTGKIFKYCCKTDDPIQPKSGRDLLDLNTCGRQNTDRFTHGEIVMVFEYPWMALLGQINDPAEPSNISFHCGGSLIAESFVLSAAHCSRLIVDVVRVGDTHLFTRMDCVYSDGLQDCADPYQDIEVDQFIIHPNYSASKKNNDIALIKLKDPAELNDNVRPICLPLAELLPRKLPLKMAVSGWGLTEDLNETYDVLQYVQVPIIEQNQCQQYVRQLSDVYTVDEGQVCAGTDTDRMGNCNGGSGYPLHYFGIKGFVIHGVGSWGPCREESSPSVYTKVSHYLDWIIDNLK